jgi:hypothetical protein
VKSHPGIAIARSTGVFMALALVAATAMDTRPPRRRGRPLRGRDRRSFFSTSRCGGGSEGMNANLEAAVHIAKVEFHPECAVSSSTGRSCRVRPSPPLGGKALASVRWLAPAPRAARGRLQILRPLHFDPQQGATERPDAAGRRGKAARAFDQIYR